MKEAVGALLTDSRFVVGSHVVETDEIGTDETGGVMRRQYGVRGGVVCVRVLVRGIEGWGGWHSPLALVPSDFTETARLVEREEIEAASAKELGLIALVDVLEHDAEYDNEARVYFYGDATEARRHLREVREFHARSFVALVDV